MEKKKKEMRDYFIKERVYKNKIRFAYYIYIYACV